MKRITLLLTLLIASQISFSQQYHMLGRFVNTAPDSISLDSVAFQFTATTYAYYVNASTTPSSAGTYMVVTGSGPDTLMLTETGSGVCESNGGGNIIKFKLQYMTNPFYQLTITETPASIDSCPSHSYKIQGDYIADGGTIVFTSNVASTETRSALQTIVSNNSLSISSLYNEQVSVSVMGINGQKAIKTQHASLSQGQPATFDLTGLNTGMYFIIIQSEHERKAIKVVL